LATEYSFYQNFFILQDGKNLPPKKGLSCMGFLQIVKFTFLFLEGSNFVAVSYIGEGLQMSPLALPAAQKHEGTKDPFGTLLSYTTKPEMGRSCP
jgi:hypothetical protein